ncbi:MAG: 50S ribosomal protein L25 [Acidimicrobiales bacterium]
MQEVTLTADPARPTGSAASRRLRIAGKVPAVLYGHGVEPQALAVDARELRAALMGEARLNALISLDVGDTRHLAMARQLQRDPVRGTLRHVDFVIVRRDEVVSAEVPIRLVGEAVEVDRADGLVEQQLFSLVVHARPGDLPPSVEVDVSSLTIGDSIRVGDLVLPSGVSTELEPDEAVVIAQASRVAATLESTEAEGAAGAEEPGETQPSEG